MRPLNVLIGANGSGKSNFVTFFKFLRSLVEQKLLAVGLEDGADVCLYMGPRVIGELSAEFTFDVNRFGFSLLPTPGNRLVFKSEDVWFKTSAGWKRYPLGSGHQESQLKERVTGSHSVPNHVYDAMSNWIVYQFQFTSIAAGSVVQTKCPRVIHEARTAFIRSWLSLLK